MTEKLSVPFLNRIVDAMLDRADPKADQNIWDLARAAEEVCREVKGEQLVVAYGGPLSTAASELTQKQREWIRRYGPTDRMQLGEVERLFAAKCPSIGGENTARKVDALIQDHQSATQRAEHAEKLLRDLAHKVSPKNPIAVEKIMEAVQGLLSNHRAALREIEHLRGEITELASYKDRLTQSENELQDIRGALDPDGQFEDESLIVLARERMNQRAYRGTLGKELQSKIRTLREQLGAMIEEHRE